MILIVAGAVAVVIDQAVHARISVTANRWEDIPDDDSPPPVSRVNPRVTPPNPALTLTVPGLFYFFEARR